MTGILNIQMKPVIGNKELNLKKVEYFISKWNNSKEALSKKLDLVVLPEFFSTGISEADFVNAPEDENGGDTIVKIKEFAKKYSTNFVAGTVIEKSADKLYNTMFVINREGNVVAKYRKIHLFNYLGGNEGIDVGGEITSGNEIVTADLDIGKLGLAICFDIRYPIHFNKLIKKNVDMIVVPSAWCVPNEIYKDLDLFANAQNLWLSINRTRAYDNMVYIITCDQVGAFNEKFSCLGSSVVVAPNSEIISNAKIQEGAFYSDIDLSCVKYYRQIFPIAMID